MAGFNYYGKSTNNIISTPLILVSAGNADYTQALGLNRNLQAGDITISRPINNEYGTISDHLQFTYALIKENLEPFYEDEQIAVERWLTSPKLSSTVGIFDCNGIERFTYFGLFTNTVWLNAGRGNYAACVFTFTVNGSYPYETNEVVGVPFERTTIDMSADDYENKCVFAVEQGVFAIDLGAITFNQNNRNVITVTTNGVDNILTETEYESEVNDDFTENEAAIGIYDSIPIINNSLLKGKYEPSDNVVVKTYSELEYRLVIGDGWDLREIPNDTIFDHVLGRYDMSVICLSDELEEYVYPIVEITPYNSDYLPGSFSIVNLSDNNKSMKVSLPHNAGIKFDCRNCMVTELNTNVPIFSFKDLGWGDVGNIYWLKLINGINTLRISGTYNVKITFDIVKKKAGGWLI